MKRLSLLLLLTISTLAASAVQCPFRIQASAGSGSSQTSNVNGNCNAPTTLIVCEDELLNLRILSADMPMVFANGYQTHSFTATDVYSGTTQSIGVFIGNFWQTMSLAPGTYDITGSYFNGSITYGSANLRVSVIPVNVPTPTLSAAPYCINTAISVVGPQLFYNWSNYISQVEIDMGDGTILQSNTFGGQGGPGSNPWQQINTTHSYAQPGTYNVVLNATYPCGVRTSTTTIQVGPIPSFGVNEPICQNSAANFSMTATCQNQIDAGSVSWDFGDGSTGTGNNPVHNYTSPGTYTASMSFTVNGQTQSTSQDVEVYPSPLTSLGADQSFCPNGPFSWPTLNADNIHKTYTWSFNGDILEGEEEGNGSLLETFDWGTYCVTVTNGYGCAATDCMNVTAKTVFDPIDPNFDLDFSSNGCTYNISVFPNDTRNGLAHQWYVYKNQPAGTTSGGTLDAGYNGNFWSGSSQLPYNFDAGTWYYIKHGMWSECDPWTEKRQAIYWSCKTGEVFSLTEDEIATLNVYPNPADEIVNLTGFNGSVSINIYSLDGRLVQSSQGVGNTGLPIQVDVSSMTSGIYMIQARDQGGNTLNERLIVE